MVRGKDSPNAPRALRREATRASLIEAAHVLAERAGADPLDPAEVAAEAGASRSLFYAHFPTRGDFVDAILQSIHEEEGARTAPAPSAELGPTESLLAFFARLAEPLDRHAALARAVIPASHLPGPVADARMRRRTSAVARLADLIPSALPLRTERAAFLMDAFLGVQLAWSKASASEALADRVGRDLAWAVQGVLAPPSAPIPPSSPSLPPSP